MIGGCILLLLRATKEKAKIKGFCEKPTSMCLCELVSACVPPLRQPASGHKKNSCICDRDVRKYFPFKNSSAEGNRTLYNRIIFRNN